MPWLAKGTKIDSALRNEINSAVTIFGDAKNKLFRFILDFASFNWSEISFDWNYIAEIVIK